MPEQQSPGSRYPAPFGSDRVEPSPDGAIWLVCKAPKDWSPRRGRAQTSSEFPGTAVRWETGLFEVVEAMTHLDGTVRYKLEPWADRHTVRAIQTYGAGSEAGRALERSGRRKSIVRRRLAILFSPLLGHLPGPVQERMESEFGAPAVAMTIASALPLFALGLVSFLFSLAAAFAAGFSGAGSSLGNTERVLPRILPLPVALYLFIESGIRMGAAFLQARPIGSLPGTLFFGIWRALRANETVPTLSVRGSPASPERALYDRFRMLEPLLALLTPAEQQVLERRFGMEVLRWGKVTAVLLLIVGATNVFASLAMFAAGTGGPGDFLWLLAGVGLSIEQVGRLRQIASGRAAGSFLGAFVRPLAGKLLRPDAS